MSLFHSQTVAQSEMPFGTSVTDLHLVETPGGPVLHALGGDGLTALSVTASGALSVVSSFEFSAPLEPGLTPLLASGTDQGLYIGGARAAMSAIGMSGSSYGTVSAPGGLAGPLAAPVRVTVEGTGFVVGALPGEGVVSYRIAGDDLQEVARISSGADVALAGVRHMAAVNIGGTAFVLAAASADNEISVLSVAPDGSLSPAGRAGVSTGIDLSHPGEIAVAKIGGVTYAIVAAPGSSSLTVFEVGAEGHLTRRDHVVDSRESRFAGASAVDAVTAGGTTYVAAGGSDDGVSLFVLLPGGRLVEIARFENTVAATLTNTDAIEMYDAGGTLEIFASGAGEAGITRLSYNLSARGQIVPGTGAGNVLNGTALGEILSGVAGDDLISGGGGDDILIDGPGSDVLRGGAGADIFVLVADGARDRIEAVVPGEDLIDLSAWPGVYGIGALSIMETGTGAILSHGREVLTVTSADGQGLDAADIAALLMPGPHRPAAPEIVPAVLGRNLPDRMRGEETADILSGRGGNDRLIGGGGDDRLYGGRGNDWISGGIGNDVVLGGAGRDRLMGGDGEDRLLGGPGADLILGHGGGDVLLGAAGNDRLFGASGSDVLLGGSGTDVLDGGAGDDILRGGGGSDRLVGGEDADRLFGDGGHDRIGGGAGADTLFGGGGNDRMNGGAGADVLHGGPGADMLMGGTGADVFVLSDGGFRDRVLDFDPDGEGDRIDLAAVSGIEGWSDLAANHLFQIRGAVRIAAGTDAIDLIGIRLVDLDADDFLF